MKKTGQVYLALSIFCMIAGLILIVVGAVKFRETKEVLDHRPRDRIGVVVDAGGSGTRLLIYSYSNGEIDQLYYNDCEEEGMGTYTEEQLPKLKKLLTACIDTGVRNQNLPAGKKVPIYVGATAGMRLLRYRNLTMYNKIWDLVKEVIAASPLKAEKTDTITGFEEAKWALVAANYLKKTVKEGKDLYGSLDLGSSSVQIAFPNVNINGKNLSDIYGHSYLCYGKNEMVRHFQAKITKMSNYSKVVKNPCLFQGYNKTVTSDYLWKPPCVSGDYAKKIFGEDIKGPAGKEFIMEGAGNYEKCSRLINSMIDTKCPKGTCGMNGVFQPAVHGEFLALSAFWHAANFIGMSKASAGKEEYLEETKKYCDMTWDELKKAGKAEPAKYQHTRCFDASYAYFLLTKAFKFDDDTWNIEFTKKINGETAQWSLGLMYTYQKSMYERFTDTLYQVIEEKPGLIAVIAIGLVLVIISCVFIFLTHKAKNASSKQGTPGLLNA